MEPNKNIIAPVRTNIEKRKIDKVRVGCTILLILFVLGVSIFCIYWVIEYKELKEQGFFEINNSKTINERTSQLDLNNFRTLES